MVRRGVRTPSRGFWLFSERSLSSLYVPNICVQNHIMSVICYVNIFFFFFLQTSTSIPIKRKTAYKIHNNTKRYFSDIVPKQMKNIYRLITLGEKNVPTFSLLDSISYFVSDLRTF